MIPFINLRYNTKFILNIILLRSRNDHGQKNIILRRIFTSRGIMRARTIATTTIMAASNSNNRQNNHRSAEEQNHKQQSDLYVYVHGLASSSRSSKGIYLQNQLWNEFQIPLTILDLNQDNYYIDKDDNSPNRTSDDDNFTTNFTSLTLSRQIEQVTNFLEMNTINTNTDDTINNDNTYYITTTKQQPKSVTLIGSSLGALTVAWVTHNYLLLKVKEQQEKISYKIDQIILLAPAFHFLQHWIQQLDETTIQQWKETNFISMYHYGYHRTVPLHYQFVTDLQKYNDTKLFIINDDKNNSNNIVVEFPKTLLVHGIDDEVIPLQSSLEFIQQQRPWIQFVPVHSDHSVMNTQQDREILWYHIKHFLITGTSMANNTT